MTSFKNAFSCDPLVILCDIHHSKGIVLKDMNSFSFFPSFQTLDSDYYD